jgi:hypothetical protein
MAATASSGTTRIPAWRKIGLRLAKEQEADISSDLLEISANAHTNHPGQTAPDQSFLKRGSLENDSPGISNRKRIASRHSEKQGLSLPSTVSRKKSVTFAETTKIEDGNKHEHLLREWEEEQLEADQVVETAVGAPEIPEAARKKRRHKKNSSTSKTSGISPAHNPSSHSPNSPPTSSTPSPSSSLPTSFLAPHLKYLNAFHHSRDTWKFNKAQQITLLKYAFDREKIPTAYEPALYSYLQGLQGLAARERLISTAQALLDEPFDEPSDEDSTSEGTINMDSIEARKEGRLQALQRHLERTEELLYRQEGLSVAELRASRSKKGRASHILCHLLPELDASQHQASLNKSPLVPTEDDDDDNDDDDDDDDDDGTEGRAPKRVKIRARKIRTEDPDANDRALLSKETHKMLRKLGEEKTTKSKS